MRACVCVYLTRHAGPALCLGDGDREIRGAPPGTGYSVTLVAADRDAGTREQWDWVWRSTDQVNGPQMSTKLSETIPS